MNIKKIIILFCGLSFCVGAGGLGIIWSLLHTPLLDTWVLDKKFIKKPSIILDYQGKKIGTIDGTFYECVSYHKIPKHVINAFVAAEDWNFFHHTGLSLKGIIRSALVNIYHGKKMQGASTITQQLVKLYFFDNKKTFIRKIKEQLYALIIEQQYSKEQIFEYYVNSLYFGHGLYGIQAAAHFFWNKDVSELSIDQAALLAAIICSPGNYSPIKFPLSAQKRRNNVITKMEKLHFIYHEQACSAQKSDIELVDTKKDKNNILPLAIQEYIKTYIENVCTKEQREEGGLIIHTTIHSELQKKLSVQIVRHCKKLRSTYGGDIDGAVVTLDNKTGGICSISPGFDCNTTYFNRVMYTKRQVGSLFKPLIYAAALEQGMSFGDTAIDEPLTINFNGSEWSPRNSTRTFLGKMTLARALVYSNNIVTIKVLLQTGISHVVNLAQRCHITGEMNPYPSLALGCLDTTLLEMASVYAMFANNGVYVKPYIISLITDSEGKKLYKHAYYSERVLSQKIANQIVHVLQIGMQKRKHFFNQWIDSDACSKTGTTNDSRTCWFIGSTPELTTAVYIGCDDNRPMGKSVFPVQTAFPLWLDFHSKIITKQKHFMIDSSLQKILIHSKTGQAAFDESDQDVYQLLV